jgi:hypothetical protein
MKCCEISYNWTLLDSIDGGRNKVTLRKGNLYYATVVFDIYRSSATAIAGTSRSLSLFIWQEDRTTSLFEENGPFHAVLFFYTEYVFTHTTLFPQSLSLSSFCRVVRKFYVG